MDKHIKLLIKSSKEFEQVCENALFEIKNQERISLIIGSLKASKHKPRPITIYPVRPNTRRSQHHKTKSYNGRSQCK